MAYVAPPTLPPALVRYRGGDDWAIDPVDFTTMNSLLRDWTSIRKRRKMVQDSEYMLQWVPDKMNVCLALSKENVNYAIAQIHTRNEPEIYIRGICVSPDHHDAATLLMEQLVSSGCKMEERMRREQPRWHIAYSFLK